MSSFFFGSQPKINQLPTMAPYQQQAFQNSIENPIDQNPLYQSGAAYLQKILSNDPSAFQAFESPLLRQFQEQIVPMISQQFAGAGTGAGSLNSSGFQQALAHEAGSLSDRLAAQRAQLQQNAAQQALGYAQQPYTNVQNQSQISPFQYTETPGSPGLFAELAKGAGSALGTATGLGMGPLADLWGQFKNYYGNQNPQSQKPVSTLTPGVHAMRQ
jgi:hypothetical protein